MNEHEVKQEGDTAQARERVWKAINEGGFDSFELAIDMILDCLGNEDLDNIAFYIDESRYF